MSEKRYFKIHSTRHIIGETNNYTRLFDAIEAQEEYNEEEIKKKFEGETFIKHLPSEKHYLYNHILESLNAFYKEKTFLTRSSNMLISIEILYNRGLFAQCLKLINKIKSEAYELEKFSALLIILRWETIVYIRQEDGKNLNKILLEEQRILEVMRVQAPLMQLAFNMQIDYDKGKATESYLKEQEKELERLLPKDKKIDSFWANYYYYSAKSLIYTVQNKQNERSVCFREIKRIMDEAPAFIKDIPAVYHLNYNNLVNVMLYLGKYNETEKLIKEQRAFLDTYGIKSPTLSKTVFLNTYESELFQYYITGHYEKAAEVSRSIESEIKKMSPNIGPIYFDTLFFMAVTELMVKNYKSATRWLNKILNEERNYSLRKEIQINTRLLYLIVLFEMDDVLFDNRLKATKRFLANEPDFKKHIKIADAIGLIEEYTADKKNKLQIKKLIAEIQKDHKTGERSVNKHFDFAGWLDSKLEQN
ncbi:MAG: hypothetical protein ACXVC2_09640 [Bacteroidia bacterium]